MLEEAPPAASQARAGTIRDPVTTSSKEARSLYERGVALLHAYDWIRAARAFHAAIRLDGDLALARLGLSMAHDGMDDAAGARAAWEAARARSGKVSARERARIDVWGLRLDALADTVSEDRFAAYRAALDAALAKWPDDVELLVMRGNAAAPLPPGIGPYQGAAGEAWFRRALALAPGHPGAYHYLAHAAENEGRFEDAAEAAATFAKLAPRAPHALHMHGHALLRSGRMAEAIARFEEADRIGAEIRKAEGIADSDDWHHSHNLSLLSSVYRYEGRMKEAEAALRRMASIAPAGNDGELDRKDLPSFLLAQGRHEEALAAADGLSRSAFAPARAIGHALAGEALLGLGRANEASARYAAAQRDRDAIEGELARTWSFFASLYVDELGGMLLLARGQEGFARPLLEGAVRNHRLMLGPDGWVQALFRLERIAAAAREAGAWELARAVTREMAAHAPAYAGTFRAQAALAIHDGRGEDAARLEKKAADAWAHAGP